MEKISQLEAVRHEKREKMINRGVDPYPNRCERTHCIETLHQNKSAYVEKEEKVYIAGRIVALRRQGKIGFMDIADESGRIQIFLKQNLLGEDNYENFKLMDIGDFVQVHGVCFITQRGEYSIKADQIKMLSKNLKPLPVVKEKQEDGVTKRYDEFADIELRYRKRYLDLLLNPEHKKIYKVRAEIIRQMRHFFDEKGFLEVETPILQPLYGGANARPFVTHHNTLDMKLYLRIATELYLKRLIVGGIEKVYEIGKNFRNEGMDRNHNPEFTALEVYQSYADYHDMMDLTEDLFVHIGASVFDSDAIKFHENMISLKKPWKRATMIDLIKEYTDFDASDFDEGKLRAYCDEHEIEYDKNDGPGKLITLIFDRFVEPKLIQPTFVLDFPKEVSPLAKTKPGNPLLVERFELFINGTECANAFTELNDPIEQRKRLEHQTKQRELGDLEANLVDEDFLEALEYGMPPTGGLGIGLDRMIMLFTGQTSIKEVILFPQMKV
jgi:lysyl-tRNA synthetase class 2